MIGISISADGIRAVRVKKTGQKMILHECETAPLEENVIANGDLVDSDGFVNALVALCDAMNISPDEDVAVGLPSSVFKIDSICVRADANMNEEVLTDIGLGHDFEVRIFFVSGIFRTEMELFERYRLTPEELKERVGQQINSGESVEEAPPAYVMIKTVSYAAILKSTLENYLSAFSKAGLKVCSIEPNALAQIRYLREDARQPFLIADVDFDYSSFICFSERAGAFSLNVADIGKQNLKTYADENDDEGTISRPTVEKFIGRLLLAADFFRENSITKKEDVNLIVFLNSEDEYLFDDVEQESNIDVVSSETMLPAVLSEKGLDKVFTEDFYLYYTPIMIAGNTDSEVNVGENVECLIEANFLSSAARETLLFSTCKSYLSKTCYALAAAAGLYFASVVGVNAVNIIQAGYLQDTPREVVDKYEEAHAQGEILKNNIAKYNIVAKTRAVYSPLIDAAVAALPPDVYLTNLSVSGRNIKSRKIVIECMTLNAGSGQSYVEALAKIPGMEKARILSQQVKGGKTAFQIVVQLQPRNDPKEDRQSKREGASNA